MKKARLSILISFLLLTACAGSPSEDTSDLTSTTGQADTISSRVVKAFKDLYVVKKLELLLLERITDDESAEKVFYELENLELEKNALIAELGQSGRDQIPSHDGKKSESERSQISLINSKITQEEMRLKNIRSYTKFKKNLQTKTAIADEFPLYTPSRLTPKKSIDIEQNKRLVVQEIALALDAWPAQKPALRQAEQQISDLIAAAPNYAPVWIELARWHIKRVESDGLRYQVQRYQKAEEALQTVLRLEPKNANVWATRGEIAVNNKQWYKAQQLLNKAQSLSSSDPWLSINLGKVAEHFNDRSVAYGHYRNASRLHNQRSFPSAVAHGHLARLLLQNQELENASNEFEDQINLTPRTGLAKALFAEELLFSAGEYNRVIEMAEKLSADVQSDTHAMAHYLRWAVNAKRGNSTEAVQSLVKAQQIMPDLNLAMVESGRFRQTENLELLVHSLKNQGVEVNSQNRLGQSALHTATKLGNLASVEKLVELGAKIDLVDARYNTPLLLAVHEQNAKMVELLIELGANPEQTYSITNSSPLAYAVMLEDRATIRVFLESNVNVNAIDRNGLSILTLAVTTGNSDVVTQVAEAGGQFQGKIDGRWSPLEFAKAIGNETFVDVVAAVR